MSARNIAACVWHAMFEQGCMHALPAMTCARVRQTHRAVRLMLRAFAAHAAVLEPRGLSAAQMALGLVVLQYGAHLRV